MNVVKENEKVAKGRISGLAGPCLHLSILHFGLEKEGHAGINGLTEVQTNRPTDRPMEAQTILKRCEDVSQRARPFDKWRGDGERRKVKLSQREISRGGRGDLK